MIKLSKENTKRQLAIHGWVGLLFGFLLYIVVFTGSVVVFEDELGEWSISGFNSSQTFEYPVHQALEQLADNTASELWGDIDMYHYQGNLLVFFHQHKKDRKGKKQDYGVQYTLNPVTMKVVDRQIGFRSNFDNLTGSNWVRFMREMHTNLYIPGRLGLYATGLLGLLLLVSAVSGLFLHRHLLKDMFLSPRKLNRKINYRDGHSLAGTWVLPYAFVLAFTGAFLSFATSLGLPVMAYTAFKGDVEKATTALLSRPDVNEVAIAKDNQLYNLDALIANASQMTDAKPVNLTILNYGTPQTLVKLNHRPSDTEVFGRELLFNGNSGEFVREIAIVGHKPTVSSNSLEVMFSLHFGNFAGRLSKLIWFGLGLLLCYVTLTGFRLWFERRLQQPAWQRLALSVPIISYGVPISFLTAGVGFFLAYSKAVSIEIETMIWYGFFAGWLLSLFSLLFVFVLKQSEQANKLLNPLSNQPSNPLPNQLLKHSKNTSSDHCHLSIKYANQYFYFLLALCLLLLPLLRWQSLGYGWGRLWHNQDYLVLLIDLVFLIMGLLFYAKFLKASVDNSESI